VIPAGALDGVDEFGQGRRVEPLAARRATLPQQDGAS